MQFFLIFLEEIGLDQLNLHNIHKYSAYGAYIRVESKLRLLILRGFSNFRFYL